MKAKHTAKLLICSGQLIFTNGIGNILHVAVETDQARLPVSSYSVLILHSVQSCECSGLTRTGNPPPLHPLLCLIGFKHSFPVFSMSFSPEP